MKVFSKYNFDIYNAIYNSKDYDKEVDILNHIIKENGNSNSKKIIDLGCGTGNFTIRLINEGYKVEGVDFSESFVNYVKKNSLFKIYKANILNFKSIKKFDVAISMFHVVSYFKSLIDLDNFLANCKTFLNKNGLLVFDFWNTPCVLNEGLKRTVKEVKFKKLKIIRTANPIFKENFDLVDVNLDFKIYREKKLIENFNEMHTMKHYSIDIVEYLSNKNGFEIIDYFNINDVSKKVSESWGLTVILKMK
jgi:2-polyprenyl-3-methyl-5-hydroxy-6-metoxy-1,4-benzoquinol methylase